MVVFKELKLAYYSMGMEYVYVQGLRGVPYNGNFISVP